ncbi:GrpB family protein [Paenibacillus eucommiae]|uniref:GrpB-like predicted nucleotidyltransferase (UPF0157 family) n=1 Tax=Paenibacillus eucommiae TaxID=1355755 RepID=A0ABS4IQF7_9BACL|nr:GrpB family protein [Paenibacillus eucommiae]MBP1989805.1 GrpB-like predicted nucleotidyltransferase (UPF0157 family) [Paenibacillus eucommiae]
MAEPIIVLPYDREWKKEFLKTGNLIRNSLGEFAIRIDHIGSTSIEGLDAKPIIDIQITVKSLDPLEIYKGRLEKIGYFHKADNPDKTKRYFRELPGKKRTHIHVRESGSWSSLFPLLFRDYMRCHENECNLYAELKYKLMNLYANEREKYVEEKEPLIWEIMRRANHWSQETGWKPEISDI